MKKLSVLLLSVALATVGFAQKVTNEQINAVYNGLYKQINKRAYTGQYPLPSFPKATPEIMTRAHDAAGAPLNFTDRVWFPGEWEEVKAIIVSPSYLYFHPDHLLDSLYYAVPVLPGLAAHYYKEHPSDEKEAPELDGYGQYMSLLDVQTERGEVFLRIMDAIQRAGVEAWVRIESSGDAMWLRNAMERLGLMTDNIRFFEAPGNQIWMRDCGPICFYYGDDDELAMLDFFYGSDRPADDILPSALHREMGIPNYISDIVWEGGNCLVDGVGALVTSEAIVAHNEYKDGPIVWDGRDYRTVSQIPRNVPSREEIIRALQEMVGQAVTIVVPRLEADGGTGHVDLYADAIDENGFLFAQMPEQYSNWYDYATAEDNVNTILSCKSFWGRNYYNMGRLPFPAKDDGSDFESEKEYGSEYARSYSNHCIVNNYIIQPCFSPVGKDWMPTADWDRKNIEKMKEKYPGYKFFCIDMRPLDRSGGSIHCVTKQIPADNPVRILHKHIHGSVNAGTLTDIPFRAIITNKSGIAKAQLVYRVNKGEWKIVELTGNGNSWYCKVPVSEFTPGEKVEYFFSATSNNDKTITKPLNATYGGFFTFSLTDEGSYDETMFDFETAPVAKEKITFTLGTSHLYEDTSTNPKTAISELKADNAANSDNSWYTIGGSRLSGRPSAKGLYIYNGKKIAIR